jgi:hypothetical protein
MNKLLGAMKLNKIFDISFIIIFCIAAIYIFFMCRFVESNIYHSTYFLVFLISLIIPIMESTFLLSLRYLAYSKFSSSRKVFYKSLLISVISKAISFTFVFALYMFCEKAYASFKHLSYCIEIFGVKNYNLGIMAIIQMVLLYFSMLLFCYSLGNLFAAIEKYRSLFFIINASICIAASVFLISESIVNFNNCILVIFIIMTLSICNFKGTWEIIKRRESLGKIWFYRAS